MAYHNWNQGSAFNAPSYGGYTTGTGYGGPVTINNYNISESATPPADMDIQDLLKRHQKLEQDLNSIQGQLQQIAQRREEEYEQERRGRVLSEMMIRLLQQYQQEELLRQRNAQLAERERAMRAHAQQQVIAAQKARAKAALEKERNAYTCVIL